MEEREKILKQLSTLLEGTKHQKISDFDTGMLYRIFEKKTGSSEEKYNDYCDDLMRVHARLLHIKVQEGDDYDNRFDELFKDIETFSHSKLPTISTSVDDYSQREGRMTKRGET